MDLRAVILVFAIIVSAVTAYLLIPVGNGVQVSSGSGDLQAEARLNELVVLGAPTDQHGTESTRIQKPTSQQNSPYEQAKADPNNPRVQSVLEAARTGKYPERLDVSVDPKPFDQTAFQKDPQAYLNTIEPGRVYQTMPPKKGAPRLQMIGKNPTTVDSGADVVLKVQAVPGAPVSFFAQRGGIFRESTLNSITVQADEKGVATVTFFANPGTVAIAPVVVGSPMLAGNEEIMVSVRPEHYTQKLQSRETGNP